MNRPNEGPVNHSYQKMSLALQKMEINPKFIGLPDKSLILYCLIPTMAPQVE